MDKSTILEFLKKEMMPAWVVCFHECEIGA